MKDDNWELINGPIAHEIEVLNYSNQVNNIECLVKLLVATSGLGESGCKAAPNDRALKELHRTGTLFLLREPGSYRTSEVHVANGDEVVHTPPTYDKIEEHIEEFFRQLMGNWANYDPIEACAYSLWHINWIHPFVNGNGRTARAFSYACLCLKFGFILPGTTTVTDLIMANRDRFYAALQSADTSYQSGNIDVSELYSLLEELLIAQLESMPS